MKNNIEQRIKRLGLTCTIGDRQFVNGIEVVDLGLPSGTLWAKCNLGAECETDYGEYYQFGYFEPYEKTSKNYEPKEFGSIHGFTVPTQEQFKELRENTSWWSWVKINGIFGFKFINLVDDSKYIFLPACGWKHKWGYDQVQDNGYYWTKNVYSNNNYSLCLNFERIGGRSFCEYQDRSLAFSVHLVFNNSKRV